MPLFVMTCLDHPGALAKREAVRDEHLAYVRRKIEQVKLAGPLLDDAGNMAGTLVIFEAQDADEVKAFSAADPYNVNGVFKSIDIHPFRLAIGAL